MGTYGLDLSSNNDYQHVISRSLIAMIALRVRIERTNLNKFGEEIVMQNKLSDLNNHLFAQLERLGDEELAGDKLAEEINRAKAVTDVAQQIIANGSLVLKAKIAAEDSLRGNDRKMPSSMAQFLLE